MRTGSRLAALLLLSVLPALGADAPPETPPAGETPSPPAGPVSEPPPRPAPSAGAQARSERPTEEPSLPGRSTGEIEGLVTMRGNGAQGAVASILHLTSGRTFRSEPATGSGHYKILHLPFGYYDVTIEHGGMLYPGDRPLDLHPGKHLRLDVSLTSAASEPMAGIGAADAAEGSSRTPGGARVGGLAELQGLDRTPFLKTPIGVATLVGGIVLLLILI